MAWSPNSLRGKVAHAIYTRDNFRCRYCGLDGTLSFDNWSSLSRDHLLPKGHPNRDNSDYIVTACRFCNGAANHYFKHAAQQGLSFDGLTPDELLARRLPYVQATRSSYREFWEQHVRLRSEHSSEGMPPN